MAKVTFTIKKLKSYISYFSIFSFVRPLFSTLAKSLFIANFTYFNFLSNIPPENLLNSSVVIYLVS